MRGPLLAWLALTLAATAQTWHLPASQPPGARIRIADPVSGAALAPTRIKALGTAGETVELDPDQIKPYLDERGRLPLVAELTLSGESVLSEVRRVGPAGSSDPLVVWSEVVFLTSPPGARLEETVQASAAGLRLQQGHLLAANPVSGQSVPVRMRSDERFRVKMVLAGFESPEVEVDARALSARQWPLDERGQGKPLVLSPVGFNVVLHPLRSHPLAAALSGLVLVGSFAVLAGRYRRELRRSERGKRLEQMQADGSDKLLGQLLGRYRLAQRLGAGGMATVYRGVPDATLDDAESVAIKVISGPQAEDPEFVRRFQREYDVLRRLSHPNILRILDLDSQDGLHYMVMELVRGQTLTTLLEPAGMEPARAVGLLDGALEGLAWAHAQGVVHRDLKPDNMMVTDQGLVKVMDFGLARSHDLSRVTSTGAVLGTPAYMPPEQVLGADPDARSDQYSLGVTLFEMLTGRRPFESADPMALVMMHVSNPPPRLDSFRTGLPPQLEQVIARMLRKDPCQRYPDMPSVKQALHLALEGRLAEPEPDSPQSGPSSRPSPPKPVPPSAPASASGSASDDTLYFQG